MSTFKMLTEIHFGEHALDRLNEIPYSRVLIITDPFVVSSGMIDMITKPLEAKEKLYSIFSDVVPDAPLDVINEGVDAFLKYRPDCLICVGGGSSIDSAKAIRDFAEKRVEGLARVPMIAIPTTSGTGSEVTSFAVVNDTERQVKIPLVSDSLCAQEAILDPELVRSVPPSVTADTGMDVVTHALEAYVSTDHNEFSAALAEKSLEICSMYLLRAYYDGNDMHARKKMHVASCLAGLAFNTASLGINHSLAHQLGAKFHIPHGRANAMLLSKVIEFNSCIDHKSRSKKEYLPAVERYAAAAHILGLSSNSPVMGVRSLMNWMQFMNQEMNIPQKISDIKNISAADYFGAIDEMAENALKDACTATNPRPVTVEDLKKIYADLW